MLSEYKDFSTIYTNLAGYTKFVDQHLPNPACKLHSKVEERERGILDQLLAVKAEDELKMFIRIEEAGYRQRWPQRWGCLIFPDDFVVGREGRKVGAERNFIEQLLA
ncbi:hypothetical protein ACMFMG_000960 [Clarireedia jacksonii]